ncbi:MAG: DUF87 domain-containing protein, partial [Candidatus Parcubacteria bacterium]|nr:DUF87 domain-containing protein [Candidatus Parcubacteria bacterium]
MFANNKPILTKEETAYKQGIEALQDLIAPSGLLVNPNFLKIGSKYCRTLFIFTYPRYLYSNWFSPIVNMDEAMDLAIHFHPLDNNTVLRQLRRKSAMVQAQIEKEAEQGLVRDPMLETALQDIEALRDQLMQNQEKMFKVAVYITFFADSEENLQKIETKITQLLETRLVYAKPSIFRQFEGFESSMAFGLDRLYLTTSLNSGPASTIFPFVSLDLTSDQGIVYGINMHNNGLIIFDRFSLENANMVVLGKAGGGKSYAVKMEILRTLTLGTDVFVIDPENEYQYLSESIGGNFYKIAVASPDHINPFELPMIAEDESAEEVFRSHVLNLIGLFKILLGGLSPQEEATMDRAIYQTYASRDITPENYSQSANASAPLMEDLESILTTVEGGENLAAKIYKYTKGTYAGFLNQPSNINISNRFVVFNIRELEDELRPIAMYVILNYVWTMIKKELKKRLMIVDEAWYMLRHDEGAAFLFQ